MSEMRLTDRAGNRLYLNAEERAAFLVVARRKPARDRTLCETLHFTGCRVSELLEITPARVDLSGGTITLRSLKKRKDSSGRDRIVWRSVPVPPDVLDTLNTAYGIREAQKARKQASAPIWLLGMLNGCMNANSSSPSPLKSPAARPSERPAISHTILWPLAESALMADLRVRVVKSLAAW